MKKEAKKDKKPINKEALRADIKKHEEQLNKGLKVRKNG